VADSVCARAVVAHKAAINAAMLALAQIHVLAHRGMVIVLLRVL
jgi:hypothetical protein